MTEQNGITSTETGPRTPEQHARDYAERTGKWPEGWGPFHRHFANGAIHRDGGVECDQPGTSRRVFVFDADYLDEHEAFITRRAVEQVLKPLREIVSQDWKADDECTADADGMRAIHALLYPGDRA